MIKLKNNNNVGLFSEVSMWLYWTHIAKDAHEYKIAGSYATRIETKDGGTNKKKKRHTNVQKFDLILKIE